MPLVLLLLALSRGTVDAHPLGNFTTNASSPLHFAEDSVRLTYSTDYAPVPTPQPHHDPPLTRDREFSVISTRTWRLADLGARHEMILAGLGWGSMPMHMVADELASGRLAKLDLRWPDGSRPPRPVAVLVRRRDKVLGPAGEYLAEQIAGDAVVGGQVFR